MNVTKRKELARKMVIWENTTKLIYLNSGRQDFLILNPNAREVALPPIVVILIILLAMLVCGVAWICRNCILGIQHNFYNSSSVVVNSEDKSTASTPDATSLTDTTSSTYILNSNSNLAKQFQEPDIKRKFFHHSYYIY